MKKLYLLFMMLLIMFIPGTHSIAIYQLDQPVRELNNYTLREVFEKRNMVMPDWIGKPSLGDGDYELFNVRGLQLTYNIYSGIYTRSGTLIGTSYEFPLISNTLSNESYTITTQLIQQGVELTTIWEKPDKMLTSVNNQKYTFITSVNNQYIFLNFNENSGVEKFKVQIEKGTQSTPYQVPTNGPYSNIDVGEFNLTNEQIQMYYNLYLEAVRFELENQEASQDNGGYQNIFKSILDGVKNLMQEMGNVWNFLNAPIITNDMQNYRPPDIDWSWDIIGVVRQIINNANTLAFQVFFIIPSLIYTLLGIPIHISLLSLLFSNLIFLLLGWIVVKSFII